MAYNISNHVLMRYLQRQYQSYIITEQTYPAWCKAHSKEHKEAEQEIKEILNGVTKEITAKDTKGILTKYLINSNQGWVLVVEDTNIKTMYKIEYSQGMTQESSNAIFNILLNEYNNAFEMLQTKEESLNKEITMYKENIDTLDNMIKQHNQEIELLQQTKRVELERIKQCEINITNNKDKVDNLAMKIVKPIMFV